MIELLKRKIPLVFAAAIVINICNRSSLTRTTNTLTEEACITRTLSAKALSEMESGFKPATDPGDSHFQKLSVQRSFSYQNLALIYFAYATIGTVEYISAQADSAIITYCCREILLSKRLTPLNKKSLKLTNFLRRFLATNAIKFRGKFYLTPYDTHTIDNANQKIPTTEINRCPVPLLNNNTNNNNNNNNNNDGKNNYEYKKEFKSSYWLAVKPRSTT
uniref:Uncharacterized protein n=1 Tax=Glossina palpalis gambiensis TaxID=67801 RepID=A0A1B0BBP2_9MUSC